MANHSRLLNSPATAFISPIKVFPLLILLLSFLMPIFVHFSDIRPTNARQMLEDYDCKGSHFSVTTKEKRKKFTRNMLIFTQK
jgi:hypothetical protein